MQKNYDVVIIGLGTSGSIAAIKCAEMGLSVLGIERLGQMGGTATAGGICGYYFGSDGGYYKQINEKALEVQKEYYIDARYSLSEAKAFALEQKCMEAGVEISYNTHVLTVKKDGEKVVSATFIKEGEKFEVSAKLFMDTSGNGDFSYLCGCEFIGGRKSDNSYMPYTNSLFIANPTPRALNRDSGLIDMSDNTKYSKELIKSASVYPFSWKIMNENATFLKLTPLPGVRESRKVVCEKTVTFEDAIYKKPCDDIIFYAFSNADTHEKCIALEPDTAKDWYAGCNLWDVCMSVPIPMQSLFPKGVKGLLTGGRMLSVDHTLASVVRMKSDMEKCGEAMAYIAYLSISNNIDIRDISYEELKPYLEKSEVLNEKNDVGFFSRTKDGLSPFEFPKTTEELKNTLYSDKERIAVFAAKNIENSAEYLCSIQNSDDKKGKLAAIALGRTGDERAIPVLREIVKNRDMTLPISLKMTVPLGISAIYVLGTLKDKEIISVLKDIISDKGNFNEEEFISNEMFPSKEDLSFQFITHSVAALKEIGKFHADVKNEIDEFLKDKFINNNYSLSEKNKSMILNMKAGNTLTPVPFDYSNIIKNFILS